MFSVQKGSDLGRSAKKQFFDDLSILQGVFFTGPALKVLSMELVPPNKVHREEAKPGDGVSIFR